MWKATLCSREIIHRAPLYWMNNTSSLSHNLSPHRRKNKQSELRRTRRSKEQDLKMCSKVLNTEPFVSFIVFKGSFGCEWESGHHNGSSGQLLRKCPGRSVRKIQQFICSRAETGFRHKVIFSQTAPTPNTRAHLWSWLHHIYIPAKFERHFAIKVFAEPPHFQAHIWNQILTVSNKPKPVNLAWFFSPAASCFHLFLSGL